MRSGRQPYKSREVKESTWKMFSAQWSVVLKLILKELALHWSGAVNRLVSQKLGGCFGLARHFF
jgi:hypothetical protein